MSQEENELIGFPYNQELNGYCLYLVFSEGDSKRLDNEPEDVLSERYRRIHDIGRLFTGCISEAINSGVDEGKALEKLEDCLELALIKIKKRDF
jgi:hypothetical protein